MVQTSVKKAETGDRGGRDADTPLEMPVAGWQAVARRAWARSWNENVGLVAAGTAFYTFIAIVPVLIACAIVYAGVADPETAARNAGRLHAILPQGAANALTIQLERIVHASGQVRGFGFLGALAIALFGARNAATALIAALNIAYGEKEERGFVRLNLTALIIMGAAFGLAFALLTFLGVLGALRSLLPNLSGPGGIALQILGVIVALALSTTGSASLYRYAPCRRKAKWKWVSAGSLFAAIAWLALTIGFSVYVTRWGTFAVNYGPSAAGMVLLVWLYLSAAVFLFGAQINAELERQTARDTTEGPDRPVGERGAEAADEVRG